MILKLQRSLTSSDGVAKVLAYDQHRRYVQEFDCHESVAQLFDDVGTDRVFVEASAGSNRILKIGRVLDEQGW